MISPAFALIIPYHAAIKLSIGKRSNLFNFSQFMQNALKEVSASNKVRSNYVV